MKAIVRVALAPVRSGPNVRAELVSQELLGAVLDVTEERGEWARCRGEDGYEGWLHQGGLAIRDADEVEAWWDDAGGRPAVSLDATLEDAKGHRFIRLPWGARIAVDGETAHLPDGRRGRLVEGRWVLWEEVASHFRQEGEAVEATAAEWYGVPYVWGGRTRWGADCSGFVQAVYRVHGFLLPRDSHQQAEVGEPIDPGESYRALRPGDLLYFHGRESERVTHVALSLGASRILHAAEANGEIKADDLSGSSGLERSLAIRLSGVRRLFA